MADPIVEKLQEWLKAHEQELLQDTLAMLRIPSIEEAPAENAPYGPGCRKALDFALELAQKAGFTTTDLEGHIGYADFGAGERLVMTLGHLDVVPTGPGWKHDPFGAEIEDGYIYARGTTDDKGPTMAAFYALRAIKECVPNIPARMRIAFGCNEESGFGCVHRYVETEEAPTYGIAPDSGWPCIHAEKGIMNLEIEATIPTASMTLVELEGGQRPNIVIDSCSAKVKVAPAARAEVEAKLADAWDRNVTYAWDGDVLGIYAIGKAAHGAYPFGGDSAAIRALRFLLGIAPSDSREFFEELFDSTHIGGAGIGIAGSDEVSRDLTCNLGIVKVENGKVNLLFNIRYPVTWKGEEVVARCEAFLAKRTSEFVLKGSHDSPSLYFPLDHPLVKTVVDVYAEETGERLEPGTMGGGTYARAVANTVSIGTSWQGDGFAHETDERIAIESIFKASRIYAHILYRLAVTA